MIREKGLMKKQSEPPFDLLLDRLKVGVFRHSTGRKQEFVFMNTVLCKFLGYTQEEASSVPPIKIFANARSYLSVVKKTQTAKAVEDKEIVLKTKEGKKVPVVLSLSAVLDSRGRVCYMDGIIEGSFLQQDVYKELAESRELFKTVFNHSAVSIIVADEKERIIAWNPFTEKILDMKREDLFNRPVYDLYPEEEKKRLGELSIRKKGVVSDIETRMIKKDGSVLDVNLSLSVIKNREGKAIGSIGIMHDMSIQKNTQKMLIQAKKVAESASEAKTMFLANMSHEVRTPMNTILGMVDLTLDTELTSEQRDNLLTVKNAADILLSLLNDILDLSRVEAGKIQLEHIEINIERIVSSVCKTMDILARNKGLTLQWIIDEDVPDMVKGDPVRIRQVLVNLINNAIKFTQKGKIQVEVKVKSRAKEKCELLFCVSDQGIGIDKDKLERIFDVFTQEDVSTTRQFGGTGLGLAICRKLLELMGGRIWVESKKGKGSKFYFMIPCPIVKKEEVPEALQGESIESQLMAQITRQKEEKGQKVKQKEDLYILLAEDNLVNQKMTQRIIEKKGWKVAVVENGQEVLDILEKEKFDLILMDAQMPVMDGLEATRRIRQNEEKTERGHIPIIALTARAMSGDRKKCLDCGMDGYVSKPIDRTQLYETIESFFTI